MNTNQEAIEDYCVSHSTAPSSLCEGLYEETTKNVPRSQMLIGPMAGSVLGLLIDSVRAKRVLEIGTYTGYSALAMAERLPSDGEVVTLDINEETVAVGKKYWAQSPHGKKIKFQVGPALETMKSLKGPFDFILIDADKSNYIHYFKGALELLSPNGTIVMDNTLWSGRVLGDKKDMDTDTKALRELADSIAANSTLNKTLLPIRDGLLVVRRRSI